MDVKKEKLGELKKSGRDSETNRSGGENKEDKKDREKKRGRKRNEMGKVCKYGGEAGNDEGKEVEGKEWIMDDLTEKEERIE